MDIQTIEIPEEFGGGAVNVRERRTLAAKKRIENASSVIRPNPDDPQRPSVDMDLEGEARAKLRESVVSWTLEVDPHSPTVLEELDEDFGEWLLGAIDAYYRDRRRTKSGA